MAQLLTNQYSGWRNASDLIAEIYGRDGIRGFYRGLTASYAGRGGLDTLAHKAGSSEAAIQFAAYEFFKTRILNDADPHSSHRVHTLFTPTLTSGAAAFAVSAGASKLIACLCTYSHGCDVPL
jgi:hypothetical protein